MNNRSRNDTSKAASRGLLKAGVSALVIGGSLLYAPAFAQETDTEEADKTLDTVVVEGYRSSLAENLRLKRDSTSTRDSIVAQDIAEFADVNLGEALQRIPGIALQRDTFTDEGESIVVRGLPTDFTQTTLNGVGVRLTEGRERGRAFNYQVFASELFSRIDVYKSPEARLEEGGIAATVDLQTPQPLDLDAGITTSYSAMAQYRENADNWGPRVSGLLGGNWGNVGALVSVAYQDYTIMGNGWAPDDYSCSDCRPDSQFFDFTAPGVNLNGFTEDQVNAAFFPRLPRVNYRRTKQERIGLTSTLQFQPTDRLNIIADGMYAKLDAPNREFYLFDGQFRSAATTGSANGPIIPLDVRITDQNDLYGTFGNVVPRTETTYASGETEFTFLQLRGDYEISSSLSANAMLAVSENETNFQWDFGLAATESGSGLRAGGPLIGRTFTYDPTVDPEFPTLQYDFDILNPANYRNGARVLVARNEMRSDEVFHARLDFDWRPDQLQGGDVIEDFSVKFGVSRDEYMAGESRTDGRAQLLANIDAAIANGLTTSDYLIAFPYSGDVNDNVNSNFLTEFPVFSRDVLQIFDSAGALASAPESLGNFFEVEEDITALFVQTDIAGTAGELPYRLNAGLRFAQTDVTINNFGNNPGGGFLPITTESDYSDVHPSVNLAVDVTDNLLFRASYAETLTRAPLADLGTRIGSENFGAFPDPLTASGGNPGLNPIRGEQFDLGIEWYFAPESVLSVGFFNKELDGITARTTVEVPFSTFGPNFAAQYPNVPLDTPVLLSGPVNTDELKVEGIEIGFQMPFDTFEQAPDFIRDFGITANATFIDESNGSPYPLQETAGVPSVEIRVPALRIPESAYNIGAYFERGPFAARLNYNWVDEFTFSLRNRDVDTTGIGANLLQVQDARGVLDGSLSYDINDRLQLSFQGLNLTDSNANTRRPGANGNPAFGDGNFRRDQSQLFGRVIFVGVKGSF